MGNRQDINRSHDEQTRVTITELTGAYSGEEEAWEEFVEIQHCCGIKIEKIQRRKIVWENNFVKNCELISEQFNWAADMIELVNNCQMPKSKYFREMAVIRQQPKVEQPTKTEVLHSPAEIQNFKKNLKKSVILSFGHGSSRYHDLNSQQITNSMALGPSRNRIQIQRTSQLNNGKNQIWPSNVRMDKNMSYSSKSSFRKSIISLIQDTISSAMGSQREISKQTAKDLQNFLRFSMVLEKHLGDINCMLGRIKRLFIVYIEKTFRDVIATSQRIEYFIDDIKQFLIILRESVIDYYNLSAFSEDSQCPNPFISNQENVLSACTAILFKDSTFYGIVFGTVTAYCRAREQIFSSILQSLRGSPPEKFMVKDKFCLNARTIRSYINHLNSGQSGENHVDNIEFNDMVVENIQPFKTCMNSLEELSKSKSPINKMKAIMNCSEGITSQIERFYDMNGLRKEKWMLDADQVLSIFCYIIVGAKVEHLHSHLFILDNFATSHQMISMTGYYLSVMNCAVEQLEKEYGQEQKDELL